MDILEKAEILLVEDNPIDRQLTLATLKKHDFASTVHVVEDGEQALEYLFNKDNHDAQVDNEPRVILLDLKLPKVDGIEVLRTIKLDNRTKNIPVIVLTSSAEEFDIVKSYSLGVSGYLLKPFAFSEFQKAVLEAISTNHS